MGYLFLLIALLAGAAKGYCGKKTSGYTSGSRDAIWTSIVRMLFCALVGSVLILTSGEASLIIPSPKLLLVSMLSGISTAVLVVTWLICVKKSAYMLLDVFLMLGVLIPLTVSGIIFNEAIRPTQWLGIAVLFVAVVIMCSYNNSIKAKLTLSSLLMLLICGIANGVADLSQKLFVKTISDGSVAVFTFYTYVFAALVLWIAYAMTPKTENSANKANSKKILVFIFVMAVCLFANSYFKTLAAGHLNAVLLYPLNQGCALILSTVMSVVLFKEKFTARSSIGILTAFAGLLIINLL